MKADDQKVWDHSNERRAREIIDTISKVHFKFLHSPIRFKCDAV